MTSRHRVDPELLALLDSIPPLDLSVETLAQRRAMQAQLRRQWAAGVAPSAEVDRIERVICGPRDAPHVRVLIYSPRNALTPRPALLQLHGGGYVMGSPEADDACNRMLASELGCLLVSVDYRLAPETRFPGAVEDCYAALKWLDANAGEWKVDRARIAVGGISAGGGLAAALALLTRDRGEIRLIHQQLLCPMIDDRPAADPHPYAGEFLWRREENRFGWCALLGREPGGEGVSPYAAAARAQHLEGLPSTFISVGALDLFLEESLDYGRRLTRAGVALELHVYPGAFHGFDLAASARVAQTHARDRLDALRRAFATEHAERLG